MFFIKSGGCTLTPHGASQHARHAPHAQTRTLRQVATRERRPRRIASRADHVDARMRPPRIAGGWTKSDRPLVTTQSLTLPPPTRLRTHPRSHPPTPRLALATDGLTDVTSASKMA